MPAWPGRRAISAPASPKVLGVAPDGALALRWLTLAAEAGDAVGQRNLATLYFKGERRRAGLRPRRPRCTARRPSKATPNPRTCCPGCWWKASCCRRITNEARRWALAAAEQGVATAMTRLGMLYHNALGVARDPAAAAHWWAQGGGIAAMPTARRCWAPPIHLGAGVARDAVAALAWLLRAQHGGSELAAPFLPAARAACTPDQRREAEQRAGLPLSAEGAA